MTSTFQLIKLNKLYLTHQRRNKKPERKWI